MTRFAKVLKFVHFVFRMIFLLLKTIVWRNTIRGGSLWDIRVAPIYTRRNFFFNIFDEF